MVNLEGKLDFQSGSFENDEIFKKIQHKVEVGSSLIGIPANFFELCPVGRSWNDTI